MDYARPSAVGGEARWVVVLEAATGIESCDLQRMLAVLADIQGVALHCKDRYAIQVEVEASGQAEALFVAQARCHSALAASGQPVREFVRSEVLGRDEFQRDCHLTCADATNGGAALASGLRLLRVLSN